MCVHRVGKKLIIYYLLSDDSEMEYFPMLDPPIALLTSTTEPGDNCVQKRSHGTGLAYIMKSNPPILSIRVIAYSIRLPEGKGKGLAYRVG